MTRLQDINVYDFTGGLNTEGTQFTLAENESPDMMNVEIDDRRGFRTRKGWQRWNSTDIVDTGVATWAPRNTHAHPLSDGGYVIYVANEGTIYGAPSSGVFVDTSVSVAASPHLADFASWGDVCYFACGSANQAYKRDGTSAAAALPDAAAAFNNDYTTPTRNTFLQSELVEAHIGYMFAAVTEESGTTYPNRIRWSHPNEPEDYAEADFLDINTGGGRITALMSFQDHLLIFKTDSMWALYGYNSDSWQLIQVSRSVGVQSPEAVTRSESAVFFYSPSDRGGVFAYSGSGSPVEIGDKIRKATDEITATDDVWLGWAGRRLWCSMPWLPDGSYTSGDSTCLVFDPLIGNGAWISHRPAIANVHSIVEGADIGANYPLAVIGTDHACLVRLDNRDIPTDAINEDTSLDAFTPYYYTRWFNAGKPELRKSWRRPQIIMTNEAQSVAIKMDTYWNYNEATPRRTHTFDIDAEGTVFWRLTGSSETDGFDWGDGSEWGAASASGSTVERAQPAASGRGGLGVADSVQLMFTTNAPDLGKAWGIGAIVLKYIQRRFTT